VWRGVATEKAEEVSAGLAALLRDRSRRLLGDLLRPYRRAVYATVSLIVAGRRRHRHRAPAAAAQP
jgi:ATP-binding cassette subfamily B protein